MLRITKQPIDESTILLKLEGKLLEPWIEEMQRSINGSSDYHPARFVRSHLRRRRGNSSSWPT